MADPERVKEALTELARRRPDRAWPSPPGSSPGHRPDESRASPPEERGTGSPRELAAVGEVAGSEDVRPAGSPERCVRRATGAVDDIEEAATFVADGGPERLDRAVRAAERAGRRELAARGRRTRREFAAFERAAGDYFRPGRGTSLGGDDQPGDT